MWSQKETLTEIQKFIDRNYEQNEENIKFNNKKPFFNIFSKEINRQRAIIEKKQLVDIDFDGEEVKSFLLKKYFKEWYKKNKKIIDSTF